MKVFNKVAEVGLSVEGLTFEQRSPSCILAGIQMLESFKDILKEFCPQYFQLKIGTVFKEKMSLEDVSIGNIFELSEALALLDYLVFTQQEMKSERSYQPTKHQLAEIFLTSGGFKNLIPFCKDLNKSNKILFLSVEWDKITKSWVLDLLKSENFENLPSNTKVFLKYE